MKSAVTRAIGLATVVVYCLAGTPAGAGPATQPGSAEPAPAASRPASSPAAATPSSTIAASDAEGVRAAINTLASVTGTVSKAELSKTGSVFRIAFKDAAGSKFNAVIFARRLDSFKKAFGDDLTAALQGKAVTLSGKVEEYRGSPQIVLNEPSQLRMDP